MPINHEEMIDEIEGTGRLAQSERSSAI